MKCFLFHPENKMKNVGHLLTMKKCCPNKQTKKKRCHIIPIPRPFKMINSFLSGLVQVHLVTNPLS